jgi:hypothetical protein
MEEKMNRKVNESEISHSTLDFNERKRLGKGKKAKFEKDEERRKRVFVLVWYSDVEEKGGEGRR